MKDVRPWERPKAFGMTGYTIFSQPSDFPHPFVVRPWCVFPPQTRPRWPYVQPQAGAPGSFWHPIACICESLNDARLPFPRWGLHRMVRSPGDDPVIVETWL